MGLMFDDSNEMIRHLWLAGVPIRVGVRKTKHFKLFTASVPFDRREHDLFPTLSGVLQLLGLSGEFHPKIEIKPDETASMNALVKQLFGDRIARKIGLHVGASVLEKMWPIENFAKLAKRLDHPIVLYGPGEEDLASQVSGPSLPRPLTLFEYAAFVGQLDLLVTNDTGPAHIAAATGIPQIVIYGPTTVERFGPFGNKTIAMHKANRCDYYAGDCEARTAGLAQCDRRCLRRISVNEVENAINR